MRSFWKCLVLDSLKGICTTCKLKSTSQVGNVDLVKKQCAKYLTRILELRHVWKLGKTIHIYINKDGNPSTKSTRYVDIDVNTWKENQNNQNNTNEVENLMLKKHPLPPINWLICVEAMKNYDWMWQLVEKLQWLAHVGRLSTFMAYNKYKHQRYQGGMLMASYTSMYIRS
jgi:hypothetical protein